MPSLFSCLLTSTAALALALPLAAHADERSDCAKADGTLLAGVVVARPTFVSGKPLKGIPLTHTHIRIKSDGDGKVYELAVDDVFAAGYDSHVAAIPAPLDAIATGQHLEACGIPYAGGMHWVHTNCGDTPTPQDPDGWLKVIDAKGTVGPNLEDSQKYCYLWPKGDGKHHRKHRPRAQQSM